MPTAHSCRLFSVDKATYVAENERIYRTIPLYPRSTRLASYSIGQPAHDACIPLSENGPPYESFTTWHAYRVGGSARARRAGAIIHWYKQRLAGLGWQLEGYTLGGTDGSFERGRQRLYVSADRGGYELAVSHGPG